MLSIWIGPANLEIHFKLVNELAIRINSDDLRYKVRVKLDESGIETIHNLFSPVCTFPGILFFFMPARLMTKWLWL